MGKHITIDQIASLAGVNRSTVSRALNPRTANLISESQRRKILSICDQNLYRPRRAARAFASGRTSNIALILGDMLRDLIAPIFAECITGLSIRLQELGYVLTVLHVDFRQPDREERLREILLSRQADGYLMGYTMITESIGRLIKTLDIPVVSLDVREGLDFSFPKIETVVLDAVRELLRKAASKITGKCLFAGRDCDATEYKMEMIRAGLASLRLPEDLFTYRVFSPGETGVHVGRLNGQRFAESQLDFLGQFQFIWCAADLTALGLCDVLESHGIVPGKDIMVAGFDNLERILGTPEPFLTTIDFCPREYSRLTADYIVNGIRDRRDFEKDMVVHAKYVERRSFS